MFDGRTTGLNTKPIITWFENGGTIDLSDTTSAAEMLEAVRGMCAERGVACELAMEAPMACGFGACFGCAIPVRDGGYMRLCVDGPVVRGDEVETALVPGSGH